MLPDDGDLVRGLGFVTIYSAWVEEAVDGLLHRMTTIEPFDKEKQNWRISQRLEHASKLVRQLNSQNLNGLVEALESMKLLFKERNKLVHGRIWAGRDQKDYIQSGRPNIPTRQITSAELYKLANNFLKHKGKLPSLQFFHLERAIEAYRNASS
jgi:hypothetical protein